MQYKIADNRPRFYFFGPIVKPGPLVGLQVVVCLSVCNGCFYG